MKKLLIILTAFILMVIGFQSFGTKDINKSEATEVVFEMPDEGYINDIPFNTKEVVDSLNQH
jgi:hypothetical protein